MKQEKECLMCGEELRKYPYYSFDNFNCEYICVDCYEKITLVYEE
jgi:hypothetical protein